MKRLILSISIISILAACGGKKEDLQVNQEILPVDSSLFYNSNVYTDVADEIQKEAPAAPARKKASSKPKKKVSTHASIPSAPPVVPAEAPVTTAPDPQPTAGQSPASGNADVPQAETATKKKEGWSAAAKGATIGGVGGAVAGAIISKNKVKGAIIGGVIGAAGGYIFGRKKDKESGRIDYSAL